MVLTNKPVLCNYYVTYRCNAKCSFCDIWEKPSPYITIENATQNLKDMKRLGVDVIDFTGGEPLLHQQLPELLKLAKDLGFITTVTTNALLYPKMANKLKGLIDMLHFSLDSPIESEHNDSRGVKLFDKFLESIEVAKNLGEKPDILFTVFSHNIHQIEEVYETYCVPNQFMLILNPVFEYNEVGSSLNEADLKQLTAWGKKKLVYLNQGFIELRKNGGNQIEHPVCRAGSTTIVISPENELILPCYHLGLDKHPINNQLFELWSSKDIQLQIKQEGRHEKCQGCTINCYMQPSFATKLSSYWFKALPSTLKYNLHKGTWKNLI
ncbi:MAG: radical SAM protein [Bacteroidota bacterium]|nr:radical SAM protein [Bacteroidota bacterium]